MQFLINCFFVQEKKIKRIFIRNKNNINEIKSEIVEFMNIMKKQLIAFFIIDILIFIIFFLTSFHLITFIISLNLSGLNPVSLYILLLS